MANDNNIVFEDHPGSDARHTPSDEMKGRLVALLSESAVGIICLRHRASGEWHTLLVGADADGNTYPYARMFEGQDTAIREYDPPEGSRVIDDTPEIKIN